MNNKIKIYQIKNLKQCSFKAYISQFTDFKTKNNKSSMISQIYRTIIKDYDFVNLTETELKDTIQTLMDNQYFLTSQEKEVETNILFNHLQRYINYEKKLNRKILDKTIYGTVELDGKEIEISADLVFKNGSNIELVKIKTGVTELSAKARKPENMPQNDIELYLLKKLGEKLYPNQTVISSFYHLKGKKDEKDIYNQFLDSKNELLTKLHGLKSMLFLVPLDKKEQKENDKNIKAIEDVLFFNNSEGNNIITFDYNEQNLDDEIIGLLNTDLTFNSEKCKSSDCDFCSYSTLCNHSYVDNKEGIEVVKEVKKSSGELRLTDAQKEVTDIEKGNWRVNSVAGSGKTTTMTIRVLELLKKGYSLNDILLITFTTKGAQEIKDKLNYWVKYFNIKNVNTKDLNIFTFNSFGDSIVSKEWKRLGFTEKPQLSTNIDVFDIIKELLTKEEYSKLDWLNYKNPLLNFPNAKGCFIQLIIYFNKIKSYSYTKEQFVENILAKEKDFDIEKSKTKVEEIYKIYADFNQQLKVNNLLQYQDQLLYLIELLEVNPELIDKYGYKHIIVDEYQDTNVTQIKLLHILEKYKNMTSLLAIGDNSQAIFSFTQTTPKNLIDFDKEFTDVKDIFLLDNFRSTPEICYVANCLDKLNTQRIDKEIISRKASGKIPQLIQYNTLENEYKGIADIIKQKIDEGISKHEICVISRTKKELLNLQSHLNKEKIHNVIEASELYIDNTTIQHIINLGYFFKNNEHDYYLMEYLLLKNENLLELSNDELTSFVKDFKNSITEYFETLETEESKIEYFKTLITPLTTNDEVASKFVENLLKKSFHTFNELLDYLYKVILYKDDTSIEKLIDEKLDAVVLTTAHSSKGKEWDTVITTINQFKYDDIQDNLDELEETRRLLFVDITRSKDELYITYNTNQDKSRNKGKYCLFADELEGVEKIEIETNIKGE